VHIIRALYRKEIIGLWMSKPRQVRLPAISAYALSRAASFSIMLGCLSWICFPGRPSGSAFFLPFPVSSWVNSAACFHSAKPATCCQNRTIRRCIIRTEVLALQRDGIIVALYDVCVHLGCLYEWQSVTGRFECPVMGASTPKRASISKVRAAQSRPDGGVVYQPRAINRSIRLMPKVIRSRSPDGRRYCR